MLLSNLILKRPIWHGCGIEEDETVFENTLKSKQQMSIGN